MNIVVLDGYTLNPGDNPWDGVSKLGALTVHDRTPTDKIVDRAKDAEIILTNKTPLSAETLAALPKLRFVSVLATGYNIVDTKAAAARGIVVSNVPVYGTDTVAEFVMALILDFTKQPALHGAWVKEGEWTNCPDFCFWRNPNFRELADKTIGIIGFGRIGQRVGGLAHAFRMKVLANDNWHGAKVAYPFEWREIDELLAESDFISLHCPLTPENHGMVNSRLLARVRKTAFLVNTARGPLVNEADLAEALNNGVIAGAACDVVSVEPIRPDNPLLKAKNLTITPHIAWAAREARQRLMRTTAENIAAFLAGTPVNVVNG
jgi:glycerate dehydrogenase